MQTLCPPAVESSPPMADAADTPASSPPDATAYRELLVLSVFHKPYHYNAASTWLRPCTVGSFRMAGKDVFCDQHGHNLSPLNPHFCELTAIYWAWKNLRGVERIGICHYRRYFHLGDAFHPSPRVPFEDLGQAIDQASGEAARQRALDLLEHADAIVPQAFYLGGSLEQEYRAHHMQEHWDTFLTVLFDRNPHYRRYRRFFEHSNRFIFCNMAIWRWELFERFCSELFPLLFEVYARCPPPADRYQARYLGFLSERFLMFFLYANALRLAEVPLLGLEPGA